MEKHLEEAHGLADINNDTVNTVVFNEGLEDPEKTSTQAAMASATPGNQKRQRTGSEDDEEPEPLRRKVEGGGSDENFPRFLATQEGEGDTLMSNTAAQMDSQVELMNQIKEKADRERMEKIRMDMEARRDEELERERESHGQTPRTPPRTPPRTQRWPRTRT